MARRLAGRSHRRSSPAESSRSFFQRSRVADSRKTGNDQPNAIARPRPFRPTYVQAPSTEAVT